MSRLFPRRLWGVVAAASVAGIFAVTGGCKKATGTGGAGVPSGGATQPAQTAKVSPATPKVVALAFGHALSANDVTTARALSTGDAGPQMLETLAQLASATSRLQKALKAKFGDKAMQLEIFTESPDPEEELNRSNVTITGDTAVISLSPTDKNPTRLKLIDGQWKFDLTQFKGSGAMGPQLRKMAAAWSDLAADVSAGKFATVDDFKKAYDAKTAAAAGG